MLFSARANPVPVQRLHRAPAGLKDGAPNNELTETRACSSSLFLFCERVTATTRRGFTSSRSDGGAGSSAILSGACDDILSAVQRLNPPAGGALPSKFLGRGRRGVLRQPAGNGHATFFGSLVYEYELSYEDFLFGRSYSYFATFEGTFS